MMMGKGRKSRYNKPRKRVAPPTTLRAKSGRTKVTIEGKDATIEIDASSVDVKVDHDYLDVTTHTSVNKEYLLSRRTWTIVARE
jgi:hypothetical protein